MKSSIRKHDPRDLHVSYLKNFRKANSQDGDSAEKLSCKKFCSKLIAVECAIIVHCDRFAFEIA